jgi:hypothetical protein
VLDAGALEESSRAAVDEKRERKTVAHRATAFRTKASGWICVDLSRQSWGLRWTHLRTHPERSSAFRGARNRPKPFLTTVISRDYPAMSTRFSVAASFDPLKLGDPRVAQPDALHMSLWPFHANFSGSRQSHRDGVLASHRYLQIGPGAARTARGPARKGRTFPCRIRLVLATSWPS